MAAEGFDPSDMQAKLRDVGKQLREAAAEALEKAAKDVLEESRKLVPTDTGTLAASGRVKLDTSGSRFSAGIGYGSGEAEDYALIQHENFGNAHDDGGPKFLEKPLIRARESVARDVAEFVRRELS